MLLVLLLGRRAWENKYSSLGANISSLRSPCTCRKGNSFWSLFLYTFHGLCVLILTCMLMIALKHTLHHSLQYNISKVPYIPWAKSNLIFFKLLNFLRKAHCCSHTFSDFAPYLWASPSASVTLTYAIISFKRTPSENNKKYLPLLSHASYLSASLLDRTFISGKNLSDALRTNDVFPCSSPCHSSDCFRLV